VRVFMTGCVYMCACARACASVCIGVCVFVCMPVFLSTTVLFMRDQPS